jgi:phage terminase small subunit
LEPGLPAKLTPRQARFVDEYLVDLNATQAAIRAGYSASTAREQGYRLFTNVHIQEEIEKRMGERSEKVGITAQQVIREIARVAFANLSDVAKFGPDGVLIADSDSLSEDHSAAISEVKYAPSKNGATVSVKMHSKLQALELLGKHLGIFNEQSSNADDLMDAFVQFLRPK